MIYLTLNYLVMHYYCRCLSCYMEVVYVKVAIIDFPHFVGYWLLLTAV